MSSDLDSVLKLAGLMESRATWEEGWALSEASFDPANIPFLTPRYVAESCEFMRMGEDMRDLLVGNLNLFNDLPALRRLAWHCHVVLFQSDYDHLRKRELNYQWPALGRERHKSAPLFHAYVILSGLPFIRRLHRERGIPEEVTLDTLSDYELWLRKNSRWTGYWCFNQKNWSISYFLGRLFRLGRLQFAFEQFPLDFHGYRNRRTGEVILLAGEGMQFRPDGQFDGTNGISRPDQVWTATFSVDGNSIRGFRVAADGRALKEPVTLDADEWQEIIRKSDPTIGIHIPEIGPMDHAACGESMRRAVEFFPRHFPERPFRGITCHSWLCDNQFDTLLPAESNIRRFQREFYLYPTPGANDRSLFIQLFGRTFDNLDDVPQTSSLLRTIVRHKREGGHWRNGGAVLFPEDLSWGGEVYRRGRPG